MGGLTVLFDLFWILVAILEAYVEDLLLPAILLSVCLDVTTKLRLFHSAISDMALNPR
jgi:hypothetical protein